MKNPAIKVALLAGSKYGKVVVGFSICLTAVNTPANATAGLAVVDAVQIERPRHGTNTILIGQQAAGLTTT